MSGQAAEFLAWVELARRLGASDFGVLSVSFLLCRYGGLVADWGASMRGARDAASTRQPAVVHALVRRRSAVTTAMAVAYLTLAYAANHAEIAPLAAVVIAAGASRDWLALGREGGVRAAIPFAARGFVVLGLAWTASSVGTAAAIIAAGYLVGAVLSYALNPLPPLDAAEKTGTPVDAWILLAVVMAQIYTSLDTFLLAILRSAREAGVYAAVYRIPSAWVTVVGLLTAGVVPLWTRVVRDNPAALPRLRRHAACAGLLGAVFLLVLEPVAMVAVRPLFGAAFSDGRLPLALILVATAVATITAPLGGLYIGVGTDRRFALILSGGALANVATNLVVIPHFGMVGAATTTILSEVLVCIAMARTLWTVAVPELSA